MKNNILLILGLFALSCNKNESPETLSPSLVEYEKKNSLSAEKDSAKPNIPVQANNPVTIDNSSSKIIENNNNANNVAQTKTISTNVPQKVAPGMNPPHGEPNHRCDIPVGAPLNTPKKETKTQNISVNPTNTSAPITTQNAPQNTTNSDITTAKGTNPPHGQPGHRCDIAVGVALPSN